MYLILDCVLSVSLHFNHTNKNNAYTALLLIIFFDVFFSLSRSSHLKSRARKKIHLRRLKTWFSSFFLSSFSLAIYKQRIDISQHYEIILFMFSACQTLAYHELWITFGKKNSSETTTTIITMKKFKNNLNSMHSSAKESGSDGRKKKQRNNLIFLSTHGQMCTYKIQPFLYWWSFFFSSLFFVCMFRYCSHLLLFVL